MSTFTMLSDSDRPDSARPVSLLVGLGAAAYAVRVLEVLVSSGLDPIDTYVSELSAAEQPLGGVFRATDLLAGSLLLLGALWALLRTARRPWLLIGWAGLVLFGGASVADAWLPLSCAPTADPECAARETAGLVPATHLAHAWSSSLAVLGALVGLVALTVAARRYRQWPPLSRFGPALVVLELAATAWALFSVATFQAGSDSWLLGAGQRLQVLLMAVWLGVLAYSVRREKLYW